MKLRAGALCCACAIVATLACLGLPRPGAFVVPGRSSGEQVAQHFPRLATVHGAAPEGPRLEGAGFRVLCGVALSALGICVGLRGRVAMHASFNMGQPFMPSLKGAKERRVMQRKKPFGTWDAVRQPRRWELWDILEEYDETWPGMTIISEPDEPMMPVEGADLQDRYPWAGKLDVKKEFEEQEAWDSEDRLEPMSQPMWKAPPPLSRAQKWIYRRGWTGMSQPPWLNDFEVGYEVTVPGDTLWKKFREPTPDQMGPKLRAEYEEMQRKKLTGGAAEAADDGEDGDDLDDALDAMGA